MSHIPRFLSFIEIKPAKSNGVSLKCILKTGFRLQVICAVNHDHASQEKTRMVVQGQLVEPAV